jgi:hypothetical protein
MYFLTSSTSSIPSGIFIVTVASLSGLWATLANETLTALMLFDPTLTTNTSFFPSSSLIRNAAGRFLAISSRSASFVEAVTTKLSPTIRMTAFLGSAIGNAPSFSVVPKFFVFGTARMRAANHIEIGQSYFAQ